MWLYAYPNARAQLPLLAGELGGEDPAASPSASDDAPSGDRVAGSPGAAEAGDRAAWGGGGGDDDDDGGELAPIRGASPVRATSAHARASRSSGAGAGPSPGRRVSAPDVADLNAAAACTNVDEDEEFYDDDDDVTADFRHDDDLLQFLGVPSPQRPVLSAK